MPEAWWWNGRRRRFLPARGPKQHPQTWGGEPKFCYLVCSNFFRSRAEATPPNLAGKKPPQILLPSLFQRVFFPFFLGPHFEPGTSVFFPLSEFFLLLLLEGEEEGGGGGGGHNYWLKSLLPPLPPQLPEMSLPPDFAVEKKNGNGPTSTFPSCFFKKKKKRDNKRILF